MAEEHLTVAELLARAKQEGHSAEKPRRRRHRSLDEGGVSVAELTGRIPRVTSEPEGAKHTEGATEAPAPKDAPVEAPAPKAAPVEAPAPKDAPAAEPAPKAAPATAGTPSTEETAVIAKVPDKKPAPAEPQATAAQVPPANPDTKPAADTEKVQPEQKQAEPAGPITENIPAVPAAEAEESGLSSMFEDQPEGQEEEEETAAGIGSMIFMVVIGVILGALIFKGFEILWSHLSSTPLTAALAILVTLAVVGVVHALRTEKDRMAMIVAGIAGLVLTFGPGLIVGF